MKNPYGKGSSNKIFSIAKFALGKKMPDFLSN